MEIIQDSFGRTHDYLRISLTERCNLRCFYCMPEEGVPLRDKAEFMSAEELLEIAQKFVDLGIKKIRITGGEPLIKKNASMILKGLSKLPVELAITTNAVLVHKFIDVFKSAGIKTVNVSLDSLKVAKFNEISRRKFFGRIMHNIQLLIDNGFNTKINVVMMKGINEDEIIDFIDWTKNQKIEVRFIEFMPFGGNKWEIEKIVSFKEIMDRVEAHFSQEKIEKLVGDANDTAKHFRIENHKGSFGIISSITNPFCDTCNRIRLTADGKIKNCLFSGDETDLLISLRAGLDIKALIFKSITNKKKERAGIPSFFDKDLKVDNRSMTAIGG